MSEVKAHRRNGGLTFVRRYSRGPIDYRLSTQDPRHPQGAGLYAYVDPHQLDTVYIDRFNPSLAKRRRENEVKTLSRLLSHETLHSVLHRLDESDASRHLDTDISRSGGTYARFPVVTSSGLARRGARRWRRTR